MSLIFEKTLDTPLADGQHYFWVDDRMELLIYKSEGKVRAFASICPHMGARLEVRKGSLSCPWHELDFDLKTLRGNHPRFQRACEYQVEIVNDCLKVYK